MISRLARPTFAAFQLLPPSVLLKTPPGCTRVESGRRVGIDRERADVRVSESDAGPDPAAAAVGRPEDASRGAGVNRARHARMDRDRLNLPALRAQRAPLLTVRSAPESGDHQDRECRADQECAGSRRDLSKDLNLHCLAAASSEALRRLGRFTLTRCFAVDCPTSQPFGSDATL